MSYLSTLEEVEELLTDWAVEIIEEVVNTLSPDGKPFAMEEQTVEEQIDEYLLIRDDPNKMFNWMIKQYEFFAQKLSESGLDEAQVKQVHPHDVIIRLTAHYVDQMERRLTNASA